MSAVRRELPELPERIARLPVDRGYPVPWFVAWQDEQGEPCRRGVGRPDFRLIHPGAIADAFRFDRCWICGGRRGAFHTFVIGPMCAVNRTSAEPPSHSECAEWTVQACPFLTRPHARRREAGLPEDAKQPAGIFLQRNPGVTLLWTTKRFRLKRAPNGVLFDIGNPVAVSWWAEGRAATREEIEASIDSGLPALSELAEAQGPIAVRQLARQHAAALELLPPAAA